MRDQGGELSFFQNIHVKIDIRIDISILIGTMHTKFGKQVHLQDLIQMRLMKQVLMTSLRQDCMTKYEHYISTTTVSMTTKLGKFVTCNKKLLPKMLLPPLVRWFCEIT